MPDLQDFADAVHDWETALNGALVAFQVAGGHVKIESGPRPDPNGPACPVQVTVSCSRLFKRTEVKTLPELFDGGE